MGLSILVVYRNVCMVCYVGGATMIEEIPCCGNCDKYSEQKHPAFEGNVICYCGNERTQSDTKTITKRVGCILHKCAREYLDVDLNSQSAFAIVRPNGGIITDTPHLTYDQCVHDFVEGDITTWDRYHEDHGYRCVRIEMVVRP